MKKLLLLSVTVLLTLTAGFTAASALRRSPPHKISAALLKQLSLEPSTDILIVMKNQADLSGADFLATKEEKGRFVYDALRGVAMSSQKDLLEFLTAKNIKTRAFYITNMIAAQNVTAALVKEIAVRADVAKIIASPTLKMHEPIRRPEFQSLLPEAVEAAIQRIGATKVWDTFKVKGEGIVVAGQDSGVDWTHPALRAQYRGTGSSGVDHNYNWHDSIKTPINNDKIRQPSNCAYNSPEPCDDHSHGTHTTGTMVGSDGGANQIGVAPEAKWIACRNMDHGYGSPVTYIDCFEWFLAPYPHNGNAFTDGKPELAPHVINNSWGCPEEEGCAGYEMQAVLEAHYRAGTFVVSSAGNSGPACSTIDAQPATLSNVTLSVGALNADNTIAGFSSRGPSALTGQVGPDISAPGVNIRSAVPGGSYQGGWSGTSMSGPHVAGAVALLWSAQPKLIGKVKETAELLRKTAKPLTTTKENCGGIPGTQVPNNTFGYGLIDIANAVEKSFIYNN